MSSFVHYQIKSYIQSLKFIPPASLFLLWIFILYTYDNAPILSNYGASSIAIYLTITWISMTVFSLEEEQEKYILFFQLGRKEKYLIGKWLSIIVISLPLHAFAIFYPIMTDSFKGSLSLPLILISVSSHVIFSFFGILIGTLFSATKWGTKKYSWLSAVLVIVLSISAKSLAELASIANWFLWIFPPVFTVIKHMEEGDEILFLESLFTDSIFVLLYLIISFALLIILFKRKES
ncbi:hypothetical protein NST02_13505 [Robertmurraya sp. FSL W8-0741]|uniref:hypothetical protein n=1 Tax=Robertmurraya sp. FSL W8-0741 TaxID=2954629 RepID=UPI0030FAE7FE